MGAIHQQKKRELMRAGLRFIIAYAAATLALAPAVALAQDVPPASTNTPAADSVGPRELQNFNLGGRVTRPADQPAASAPAPTTRRSETAASPPVSAVAPPATAPSRTVASEAPRRTDLSSNDRALSPAASAEPLREPPASSSVSVAPPRAGGAAAEAANPPASEPAFAPAPQSGNLAPEGGFGLLPWLLAAVALGAGAAFLLWRHRSREALAGGPQADAFAGPEPAAPPQPRPAPMPAPASAPAPASRAPAPTPSIPGLVSTRLRPWLELGFHPVRCIVDEQQVTIEFEAELFNSGSAPARAVLAEASLFNAGPAQDQELGAFFANPVGAGERIVEIPPLKRVALRSQVAVPLDQVQRYDLGGHQVFVPVIAFNALYRWSAGDGQTSVSYLLGRDTKSDKLGPFRLDLGPRVFRGLAARQLPVGIRQ
jgi:hypothetical protein